MSGVARVVALPLVAVALVVAVVFVQLAHGGGRFEPLRPADPCVVRGDASTPSSLDALTERLVLLGLDGAACRLHVSREALTLQLARQPAQSGDATAAQVAALRAGLLGAVRRMTADGTLPRSSSLVDEALDATDLNGLVKAAIRALPDAVVDRALPTDDVLTRTIASLDLRRVLANAGDPDALQAQMNAAVTQAVKDSLAARLRGLL
jgi:hypothetical protein